MSRWNTLLARMRGHVVDVTPKAENPISVLVTPTWRSVDGGSALTVNSTGTTTLSSAVGTGTPLASLTTAAQLVRSGGLWNTFIIAASARSLMNLFLPRYAPAVMEMQVIVGSALQNKCSATGWPSIVDMYTRLPSLDFSRDLLQGREGSLCVLRAPPCGWSDLGTPHRVAETLRRLPRRPPLAAGARSPGHIDLAAQHAHFERSMTASTLS